ERQHAAHVRLASEVMDEVGQLEIGLVARRCPGDVAAAALAALQEVAPERAALRGHRDRPGPEILAECGREGEADAFLHIDDARAVGAVDAHAGGAGDPAHLGLEGQAVLALLAEAGAQHDREAYAARSTMADGLE